MGYCTFKRDKNACAVGMGGFRQGRFGVASACQHHIKDAGGQNAKENHIVGAEQGAFLWIGHDKTCNR